MFTMIKKCRETNLGNCHIVKMEHTLILITNKTFLSKALSWKWEVRLPTSQPSRVKSKPGIHDRLNMENHSLKLVGKNEGVLKQQEEFRAGAKI